MNLIFPFLKVEILVFIFLNMMDKGAKREYGNNVIIWLELLDFLVCIVHQERTRKKVDSDKKIIKYMRYLINSKNMGKPSPVSHSSAFSAQIG